MSIKITEAQKREMMKIPGFKELKARYTKQQGGKGKKGMKGGSFWDDIGNWFVQAGKDVNQWLKDTKVLSTTADIAGNVVGFLPGFSQFGEPLKEAGKIAGKLGYGKMRGGSGVLTKGQIPIHRMTGTGLGGGMRMRGGSSVYNNVSSAYGKIKV